MDNSAAFAEAARMVAGMVRRRWMRWGAVGAAAAVALTGCADQEEPESSTTPSPSETITESDLQTEARGVYQDYLDAAARMWSEDTVDYTLLTEWASAEVATEEAASQQALREAGVVTVGPMLLTNLVLATDADPDDFAAYVCVDFTEARHLDSAGNDVTPEGSVDFAALHIGFERTGGDDTLVVSNQEGLPSEADSPCAS